jgi:hypothetical protein
MTIIVKTQPKNRISINNQQHGTIHVATSALGGGAKRLVDLIDVDATHLADNETLVYDAVSGKFVVEILPIVNGGTF